MRHAWLKYVTDMETNPRTLLAVHRWGQRFWIANVPIVLFLVAADTKVWLVWGLLLTSFYSLYANWSTDNGAAAAINAVINTMPGNQVVLDAIEDKGGDPPVAKRSIG